MTRADATRGPGLHTPFMDGPEAVYPAPNDYSAAPGSFIHIVLVKEAICVDMKTGPIE
jgi:hypothetical protein